LASDDPRKLDVRESLQPSPDCQLTRALGAEQALRQANNELEARVQARTADLVRVNQALRTSEAQAIAALRAKDDFLATLSHELRTPLNPVLLLATEAANNPQLPEAVRADFAAIAKNVALEARLIDDMLDLTQITHGKVALELQPFDVHASLPEVLALVREEIEQKQIDLTLKLEADPCVVLGDDVRLKQVFWNIIKNAAKFTPAAGRITIETGALASSEIVIQVTDTGIGMTAEELARIFEAFFQGNPAAADGPHRFGGLGLGLAISRKIVEMHSGSLTAASGGPNRGAVFRIQLPLLPRTKDSRAVSADPRPAAVRPPVAGARPRGRPIHLRRILLVEDHKPTALVLRHLLTRRNYAVVATASLAEARAVASRENFELLISDIGLPDGDGYELMAELHGRHGLVGIALTGYGMEEDVSRSQAAGFVAHLTKPVSVEALDSALSAACDRLNV
jgi:signal transduction histidine kinase